MRHTVRGKSNVLTKTRERKRNLYLKWATRRKGKKKNSYLKWGEKT